MVELIGIHFQIRDDYLNLQSSQVHNYIMREFHCLKGAERYMSGCNLVRLLLTEIFCSGPMDDSTLRTRDTVKT